VQKSQSTVAKVVGVAGLLFAGYVLVTSLPDIWRYIRISTM